MYGHKYTDEERQFFVEYVPGHSYKEIQQEFINSFNWSISVSQIKTYIGRHKLNTGRTGYFEKGHIPFNKGEKCRMRHIKNVQQQCLKKGMYQKIIVQ